MAIVHMLNGYVDQFLAGKNLPSNATCRERLAFYFGFFRCTGE